jgi:hypothetical protein
MTNLILADIQEMGSIPPLRVELPQEVTLPEVALSVLYRLGAPQRSTNQ